MHMCVFTHTHTPSQTHAILFQSVWLGVCHHSILGNCTYQLEKTEAGYELHEAGKFVCLFVLK